MQHYGSKKVASAYAQVQGQYPEEVKNEVLSCLAKNRGAFRRKFMLDVGCGSGRSTILFADDFEKLLGIDISQSQIDLARQEVRKHNISFEVVVNDLFPVDDNSTDVVFCGISFHYLNYDVFFSECNRVLIDGGLVACVTYAPDILKSVDGEIICDCSATKASKWEQLQREYAADCGVDRNITDIFYSRYEEAFNSIKNPTKRRVVVAAIDRKLTVAEFMKYQASINGYATKSYPNPERDPLNMHRRKFAEIFQEAGMACENDTEFVATFRYLLMIIEKTKEFGIA